MEDNGEVSSQLQKEEHGNLKRLHTFWNKILHTKEECVFRTTAFIDEEEGYITAICLANYLRSIQKHRCNGVCHLFKKERPR